MKISGLNVKITIQKNLTRKDRYGNHINVWRDFYTCWASASASASKNMQSETEETAQTIENDRTDFIIRYCEKISELNSTGYRVLLNGKKYNIQHVDFMSFDKKSVKISAISEGENGENSERRN